MDINNVIKSHWITFALIVGVLLVIFVWYYYPLYMLSQHKNYEEAGSHGDVYGAVNALFTALAFALLIYTALMQREELKLQRQELELTRKELEKSAKAQEELVQLTKDSNDFQRFVRRKEIFPELYVEHHTIGIDTFDQSTFAKTILQLVFIPRPNPLYIESLNIISSSSYDWDEESFNK